MIEAGERGWKMELTIVDDSSSQEEIGRKIVSARQDVYSAATIKALKQSIVRIRMQSRGGCNGGGVVISDLDAAFYRSVYDYWVYGNSVAEEFYYRFPEKTHEEKRLYLTERSRYQYYFFLNRKSDLHLLGNKFEAYTALTDYYKRDVIMVRNPEDYSAFAQFARHHDSCVVKPIDSNSGIGV